MRIIIVLLLLFVTRFVNGSMKDELDEPSFRYATRILIYSCSADHWQMYFWDRFASALATYLNKFCRIDPERCKSIDWSEDWLDSNHVHLVGKPSEIDSNTVEIWVIVQSVCCPQPQAKVLAQTAILDMLSDYEENIESVTHVHILHFDQSHKLGAVEHFLRTWCFTSGLGLTVSLIAFLRFFIKKQERRTAINDYMKRTMQRTKRNVATTQRLQIELNKQAQMANLLHADDQKSYLDGNTRQHYYEPPKEPFTSVHPINISSPNDFHDEMRKHRINRSYAQVQHHGHRDDGWTNMAKGRSRVLMLFPRRGEIVGGDEIVYL